MNQNEAEFGTAYWGGEQVEIVCGHGEEAWAGIRFGDEQRIRDVHLGELKAADPHTDIYEAIEAGNTIFELDFEQHLPLWVRFPGDRAVVDTVHNHHLIDFDPWEAEESAQDTYEFVQDMLRVMRQIDMAHKQPRRLLFRRRDDLPDH